MIMMEVMVSILKYMTKIKPKRLTLTIPPKSGPNPQGLNINYNTVKTVKSEKINGRNRQVVTKRS
jgi:hypothetical protein